MVCRDAGKPVGMVSGEIQLIKSSPVTEGSAGSTTLEKIMTANEFTRLAWKKISHKNGVYFWGMHFDVSDSFRHIDAHGALMDAPERMPAGGSSFRGLHMEAGPVCR